MYSLKVYRRGVYVFMYSLKVKGVYVFMYSLKVYRRGYLCTQYRRGYLNSCYFSSVPPSTGTTESARYGT